MDVITNQEISTDSKKFNVVVNPNDNDAFMRHHQGTFKVGRPFISAASGESTPTMGFEQALKFAAAHELSHFHWFQLSPPEQGKIIQDIRKRPQQLQPFLDAFLKHPGYKEMAMRWFNQHKDPNWGIEYSPPGQAESETGKFFIDARLITDELFANAAWRLTDVNQTDLDKTNSQDNPDKRQVREIGTQAALVVTNLLNENSGINDGTRKFITESATEIVDSVPILIARLKELIPEIKSHPPIQSRDNIG